MALFDVNGLIGRATQRMAAAPVFAQVAPLVVPPLDRTLHRLRLSGYQLQGEHHQLQSGPGHTGDVEPGRLHAENRLSQ